MDKLFTYKITYTNNAGIVNTRIFPIWAAGAKWARMSLSQHFKDLGYKKVKLECLRIPQDYYTIKQ